MTKDEIIARIPGWLDGMADGSIPFTVTEKWDDVYAGNVVCALHNGVLLTIFNDCDSLDYVDNVVRGGKTVEFEELREVTNHLRSHPTLLAALKRAEVSR